LSTTSLRDAEWSTTSGATSRVMSRAMCRGTRTRRVVKVVDDEQRDEPHDVLRHPDALRRRSS
jgi:hypothetical protein